MAKIRIFQPIVPEYRVALFEGVGKRYGADIEIWASEGSGQDKSYALKALRYDYGHPFKNIGPIRWQKGLSLKGLKKGDVIVICGDVHQLSSLWIAALAKLRGIGVVWWGHHVSSTSKELGIKVRLILTRLLSDVVLCYTKAGIEWFKARGWKDPVFATGNTIDMVAVKDAIASWQGEKLVDFQKTHDLVGEEVVVVCGVLRRKIRVDQLVRVMATDTFRVRGTRLVVIGDGDGRSEWELLAKDLGVAERIIWTGALRNQMDIAPWFLTSKAFVYPGIIGLSIIHAFSYGLPVVCHGNKEHHGPEFAAHEDGKTGFVFEENNEADFAAKILELLTDEPRRREMSDYAQTLAYEKYGIESMINNYCAAVDAAATIARG